jgi:uncharacterized protein YbbK (DUF523 family)
MKFPQYLWRIQVNGEDIMIRRGHDSREPITKYLRKDRRRVEALWRRARGEVVIVAGVSPVCGVEDAMLYSSNHHWDWFNA